MTSAQAQRVVAMAVGLSAITVALAQDWLRQVRGWVQDRTHPKGGGRPGCGCPSCTGAA